jgi:hypothetical protein
MLYDKILDLKSMIGKLPDGEKGDNVNGQT